MKNIIIIIFLFFLLSCKRKEEKSENRLDKQSNEYRDSAKKSISTKWYGKYSYTINEKSEDWRDIHDISVTINKDSIVYLDKGFQLYHLYKLLAIENNNILKLTFEKSLDNTDSWVLKETKDFGKISFDGKNYKWNCPYIDLSFNDGKKQSYILKKSQ